MAYEAALSTIRLCIPPSSLTALPNVHCGEVRGNARLQALAVQIREGCICVGVALDTAGSMATMTSKRLKEHQASTVRGARSA